MDLGLKDRGYIVTGASKGLGFATASALAGDGARCLVISRDEDRITHAAETIGALAYTADLSEEHAAQSIVDYAYGNLPSVDGLFISVGGPAPGTALTASDAQWRSGFESVFLSTVRLVRTAVNEHLSRSPGNPYSICLVLSSSAVLPITGLGISNGLRPGLAMLVKEFSQELGPKAIRVNALMPGRISTERMAMIDAIGGDPDAARAATISTIPLRRYGSPEEFGRVAAFLMSPAASYLTGSILAVDGGMIPVP